MTYVNDKGTRWTVALRQNEWGPSWWSILRTRRGHIKGEWLAMPHRIKIDAQAALDDMARKNGWKAVTE